MLDRSEYGLTGEGAVWHHDWEPQDEGGVDSDRDRRLQLIGAAALGLIVFWGLKAGVRRWRSRTTVSPGLPIGVSRA